jgi:hypothetical protein
LLRISNRFLKENILSQIFLPSAARQFPLQNSCTKNVSTKFVLVKLAVLLHLSLLSVLQSESEKCLSTIYIHSLSARSFLKRSHTHKPLHYKHVLTPERKRICKKKRYVLTSPTISLHTLREVWTILNTDIRSVSGNVVVRVPWGGRTCPHVAMEPHRGTTDSPVMR